jgi:DNA replication and repair protein RecF
MFLPPHLITVNPCNLVELLLPQVTFILLLDDAFDKLDQLRVSQIVSLVDQNDFGQIFITDTHKDRTLQALSKTTSGYEIFDL